LKTVTTSVNPADIYALARHYRFQWEDAQQCYVLLFPEGMIKLNGGAGEVIKRVDGSKTVGDIVQELEAAFPGVPDLKSDVLAMFDLAIEKAWIEKRS
jgi:pyrroloquinoline quinone biosynthesis protein D